MPSMHRRDWILAACSLIPPALVRELAALQSGEELVDFADLGSFKTDVRASEPRVRALDLRRLTAWETPEAEFFTFHQTDVPETQSDWALTVSGFVRQPRTFTLAEIQNRTDRRNVAVTIECSGNAPGPAANGLVSNGTWTGVGLRSLLEECGVLPEAREVVCFGADVERDKTLEYPTLHGRSLHVQDAMDPAALLAFQLNGQPLSADRGYPLRLILPGWYGMANIKWLRRLEVLDRRFEGPHMSRDYHSVHALSVGDASFVLETAITRTRLKSVVARVTRRREGGAWRYRVSGAAWGGPSPVRSVELKVDGGEWRPTRIDHAGTRDSWRLWSVDWPDASPGAHTLVSRAVAEDGTIQPTIFELREGVKTSRENHSQWTRRLVLA